MRVSCFSQWGLANDDLKLSKIRNTRIVHDDELAGPYQGDYATVWPQVRPTDHNSADIVARGGCDQPRKVDITTGGMIFVCLDILET